VKTFDHQTHVWRSMTKYAKLFSKYTVLLLWYRSPCYSYTNYPSDITISWEGRKSGSCYEFI